MEASEQIDCPAPLPEDTADALLTEMLTPAPFKVPEKTKKKDKGTRKSSRCQVVSDSLFDNSVMHSSHEDEEKDEDAPPPPGGEKKRKTAPTGEAEGSKKGRTLLPDCSTTAAEGEDEWLLRAKPWRSRKYSDTRVTHSIPLSHCFS